jgi:hypothetical protein
MRFRRKPSSRWRFDLVRKRKGLQRALRREGLLRGCLTL